MAGRVKVKDWLTPDKLSLLEGWAKDGLSMDQLADKINISRRTLYNWQEKHVPILHALRAGKDEADYAVSNALHKRATGYSYDENTYETVKMGREEYDQILDLEVAIWKANNPKATQDELDRFILSVPETKLIVTKRVTKHVPPDTRAAVFWLANRQPDAWKNESKIEHTGQIKTTSLPPDLSLEQLQKLARLAPGDDDE
jgi:transcriptional regulator with XRE-family HTH domain